MKTFATAILAGLSILAGGCSISPPQSTPPNLMCNFDTYEIVLPVPSAPQLGKDRAALQDSPLAQRVQAALASAHPENRQEPRRMLFLSGGSLHGAFGAGFLHGWRASLPNRQLPVFDVVTGISTGSIFATFAFIGDTDAPERAYRISDERELLDPIVRMRNGRPSALSYLQVVRRGALADLAPMRQRLLDPVNGVGPQILRRVVERARANGSTSGAAGEPAARRLLFIGVVDVDTGQAVALDMVRMAERYVAAGSAADAPENAEQARLRACYVEAIVASSSVPLAALPVFIDNRMFIDGGARFGMFSEDVIAGIPSPQKNAADERPTELYVIANGDLEIGQNCSKRDERLCEAVPGSGGTYGEHRDWSLIGLASRSEQILVNQVYRFSASHIISRNKPLTRVHFARIGSDAQSFRHTLAHPSLGQGTLSCAEWRAMDRDRAHPIQFFPRYMHCLVAYGRARGREENNLERWDFDPDRARDVAGAVAKP